MPQPDVFQIFLWQLIFVAVIFGVPALILKIIFDVRQWRYDRRQEQEEVQKFAPERKTP